MDGWTLAPDASTASTLRWEKAGQTAVTWEYEGDAAELEAARAVAAALPAGAASRSKRKRGSTDYVGMDARMRGGGSGGAEEGGAKRFIPPAGGLSALLSDMADDDEDDEDVDEGSLAAEERRRKLARQPLRDREAVAAVGQSLAGMADPADLLAAFKRLEEYPMDVASLKASGVAKAIKPFRKHADAGVAAAASALFQEWKAVAKQAGVS